MRRNIRNVIACIILLAAVALIVLGIIGGEFSEVANKARMICYECIGLG